MDHPPSYSEYASENLLKPKDYDVDVKSVASSIYDPTENDLLHVYNNDWKGRDGKIYGSDKQTVLYEIAQRNRKPQLTVRDADSSNTVGTLEFHTWSRKMDADVHGSQFRLGTSKACWKSVDVRYDSPAFGQEMVWKRSTIWVVLAITLVDSNGFQIARFEPVMARKKFGRIHIFRNDLTKRQLDEVVFTGMSVMMDTYFYTTQQAGSAAGAASGAAAAAAVA